MATALNGPGDFMDLGFAEELYVLIQQHETFMMRRAMVASIEEGTIVLNVHDSDGYSRLNDYFITDTFMSDSILAGVRLSREEQSALEDHFTASG